MRQASRAATRPGCRNVRRGGRHVDPARTGRLDRRGEEPLVLAQRAAELPCEPPRDGRPVALDDQVEVAAGDPRRAPHVADHAADEEGARPVLPASRPTSESTSQVSAARSARPAPLPTPEPPAPRRARRRRRRAAARRARSRAAPRRPGASHGDFPSPGVDRRQRTPPPTPPGMSPASSRLARARSSRRTNGGRRREPQRRASAPARARRGRRWMARPRRPRRSRGRRRRRPPVDMRGHAWPRSGSRVELPVHPRERGGRQVGVDLGGRDVGVTSIAWTERRSAPPRAGGSRTSGAACGARRGRGRRPAPRPGERSPRATDARAVRPAD